MKACSEQPWLRTVKWTATASGLALAIAMPSFAAAQSTGDSSGSVATDDIIVTAQRRSESVRDTPLAITAVSGENLQSRAVTKLEDISNLTPNVYISQTSGNAHIVVRGIGIQAAQPGSSGNIAVHVDGVYVSRPTSTLNSFFDVDRLEVVRGPQGTLYGRNATGGAINIITRDPSDTFKANALLTVGNYGLVTAEGGIGGPIADGISFRLAFQTQNRDGYGWQEFPIGAPAVPTGVPGGVGGGGVAVTRAISGRVGLDDLNTRAVRAKLKLEPSDNLSIVLAGEYYHQNDHSGVLTIAGPGPSGAVLTDTLVGGILAPNPNRNAYTAFPQGTRKEDYVFSGTVNWDLTDWLNLTSITGYRNTDYFSSWNQGGSQLSTVQYTNSETGHQISEELRASGKVGRLTYVLGGFLYKERQNILAEDALNNILYAFPPAISFLSQGYGTKTQFNTNVRALFGQLSYELTDTLGIDAGLRYNWERVRKPFDFFGFSLCTPYSPDQVAWNTSGACDFNSAIGPRSVTSSSVKPKVTLRYKPNSDLMFYATFSQGFRSGGFNFGSATDDPAFLPEEVTDWEGGVKASLFDRRLTVDLSGFYYKYKNLQVSLLNDAGTAQTTKSAGKATLYGLEASIVGRPTDQLRIDVNVGLLHSRYDVFSAQNTALISPTSPLICSTGSPLQCGRTDPTLNALGDLLQNLSGNSLPQAPNYNISVGVEYTVPSSLGDFTLRGVGTFVDTVYFTPFEKASYFQKSYSTFDAFLRWNHPNGRYNASLFMKNIADKQYYTAGNNPGQVSGSRYSVSMGAPRTFGAMVGFNF